MAYTKTTWVDGTTPINAANLNNMETQYDEAVGYANTKRADADEILKCEIVATLPAAAQAHAGRIVFNQADGKFYGGTGTAWRVMRSASGDAAVGDVLAGKTFSNATADGLTGTMPNRGAVVITPGTAQQAIAAGYHSGTGYVEGDADLVAAKIKKGVDIFGVAGTFEGAILPDASYLYYFGQEGVAWANGYATGTYVRGKDEYCLRLSSTDSVSSNNCAYVTNSTINLTGISQIIVDWAIGGGYAYLVASTTKNADYNTYDARVSRRATSSTYMPGRFTEVLDVSALSGNYYIRVHGTGNAGLLVVYSVRADEDEGDSQ